MNLNSKHVFNIRKFKREKHLFNYVNNHDPILHSVVFTLNYTWPFQRQFTFLVFLKLG